MDQVIKFLTDIVNFAHEIHPGVLLITMHEPKTNTDEMISYLDSEFEKNPVPWLGDILEFVTIVGNYPRCAPDMINTKIGTKYPISKKAISKMIKYLEAS